MQDGGGFLPVRCQYLRPAGVRNLAGGWRLRILLLQGDQPWRGRTACAACWRQGPRRSMKNPGAGTIRVDLLYAPEEGHRLPVFPDRTCRRWSLRTSGWRLSGRTFPSVGEKRPGMKEYGLSAQDADLLGGSRDGRVFEATLSSIPVNPRPWPTG